MGSGSCFTVKMSWSSPSYMRCSMGSCSTSFPLTGKYSSIREMPWRFMFCVISTAFVLHGVIISRRGPMKNPSMLLLSISSALPYSQHSSSVSCGVSRWSASVAIMLLDGVLKKRIILFYFVFKSFRCGANLHKIFEKNVYLCEKLHFVVPFALIMRFLPYWSWRISTFLSRWVSSICTVSSAWAGLISR